jgi:hypothetical protein
MRFKEPLGQVISKLLIEPSVFMREPVQDWQLIHLNVFSNVLRTTVVYQNRVDI